MLTRGWSNCRLGSFAAAAHNEIAEARPGWSERCILRASAAVALYANAVEGRPVNNRDFTNGILRKCAPAQELSESPRPCMRLRAFQGVAMSVRIADVYRLLRVAGQAGRQTTLVLYATRRLATVDITLI